MQTYSPQLARDEGSTPIQDQPPPITVKQLTVAAPPAASSVITFSANTTMVEVSTGNTPLAFKWGSASVIAAAGTANFDHLIPIGQTKRYTIPHNTMGATSSIVGKNALNGLFTTMAVISASSIVSAINEF